MGRGALGRAGKGGRVGHLDGVGLQVLDWVLRLHEERSAEVVDEEVYSDTAELLLNSDASVNATDNYDWTPLHAAAH